MSEYRAFFEALYRRYGQRDKQLAELAVSADLDQASWASDHQAMLEANRQACFGQHEVAPDGLPAGVRDALAFYTRNVPAEWWGAPRLLRYDEFYAVRVTTDGDDGWLEVYALDGSLLGAARTYLELLAWGDRDAVRAMVHRGSYPPELADRMARTLYRLPASEW